MPEIEAALNCWRLPKVIIPGVGTKPDLPIFT